MATNEIQGDVVGMWISTVLTSPADTDWKEVVCAENTGVDTTRDVNTKRTKCGVIKGFGPPAYQITGSGAFNSVPGTGKISSNDLAGFAANETPVLVKVATAADDTIYYREGKGQVTKLTETANTGDAVSFDFTVDITGPLTIVAP